MAKKFRKPARSALITGASSGIGEALAVELARRGARTLHLCGRNEGRLEAVAEKCRGLGAEVWAERVDVAERGEVERWIWASEARGGAELVVANAGVATGAETAENVRRTFAVNVGGCMNTALAAVEAFRRRGGGGRRQLALMASIAGYGPLPGCAAYSASKAAVKTWGLAARGQLGREGIAVSVICPGFVRSRITDANKFAMPFFMEADAAAGKMLDGLDADCGLIAFPWVMRLGAWWLGALPWRVSEFLGKMLPAKG